MSSEGDVGSGSLEVKVVMAINAVVDELAADILERNYDAEKVAAARDSGQYATLFEGVRLHVGREIYTRGGLSDDELAQTVRTVVEPWRKEIRHTTEMRARHASDPEEYELEYWRKEEPHNRKSRKGIPLNQTSATMNNLEPGTWMARVRGWNKAGPGPWSDTSEVTIPESQ